MHKEILTAEQVDLLPLVASFMKDFGLVGGTAIALQIGHRRSIDFDLFTASGFNNDRIRRAVVHNRKRIGSVVQDESGQFTFLIGTVQLTFFTYPFKLKFSERFAKTVRIPDLLTLAAMKAYALGRRAKWKDYVDLYFIINKFNSIQQIVRRGREIFKGEFNERIFRQQLSYFDDIDYSEEVTFLPGFEVSAATIKKELVKFSLK